MQYYLQNRHKGTIDKHFSPFPNNDQKIQIQTGGEKKQGLNQTSQGFFHRDPLMQVTPHF